MKKEDISEHIVKAIVAFVAHGNSAQSASKRFRISLGNINAILNGKMYRNITGLDYHRNRSGIRYIRENKKMFTVTRVRLQTENETPINDIKTTEVKEMSEFCVNLESAIMEEPLISASTPILKSSICLEAIPAETHDEHHQVKMENNNDDVAPVISNVYTENGNNTPAVSRIVKTSMISENVKTIVNKITEQIDAVSKELKSLEEQKAYWKTISI
jgi:hypothetical protein